MAQPLPASTLFYDEYGYFRSPVDAAAYAILASGGQGFTTPAREARRMLASPDPRYKAIARDWLAANGLPEAGDAEPPDWQNWMTAWVKQHPGPEAAMEMARAFPDEPAQDNPHAWGPPPGLHVVPAELPPAPPKKVVVQVVSGSRLESLLGQRDDAANALKAAEKHLATIKDGITAELTAEHPGVGAFDIPAAPGREPLTLRYTAPNYFDTKRFRAERPDLYPQFLKPSPRWTLGVPQKKNNQ